jgi:hypothetical protein
MLYHGHQLFYVASAIEQGVIGVAVKVNERTFGHADLALSSVAAGGRLVIANVSWHPFYSRHAILIAL